MHAILGQDKELLFCEYSTIEIHRDGELSITCLGKPIEKPDYFWPILGSTDGFIVENMLQNAGIESVLDLKELQTARSKIATYQRFAQHGIRVPDTIVFFKDSDKQTLVNRFGYPFVVKPDIGFGGEGVELIHNEQELQKESPYAFAYFVLNDKRDRLYQRIDARIDEMLLEGLVAEVEKLKEKGCHRGMERKMKKPESN